jgi:hypothetical protein
MQHPVHAARRGCVNIRDGYRAGELTSFEAPQELTNPSAPILLIGSQESGRPMDRETREMNPVALLTLPRIFPTNIAGLAALC